MYRVKANERLFISVVLLSNNMFSNTFHTLVTAGLLDVCVYQRIYIYTERYTNRKFQEVTIQKGAKRQQSRKNRLYLCMLWIADSSYYEYI